MENSCYNNSIWFWGGGCSTEWPARRYRRRSNPTPKQPNRCSKECERPQCWTVALCCYSNRWPRRGIWWTFQPRRLGEVPPRRKLPLRRHRFQYQQQSPLTCQLVASLGNVALRQWKVSKSAEEQGCVSSIIHGITRVANSVVVQGCREIQGQHSSVGIQVFHDQVCDAGWWDHVPVAGGKIRQFDAWTDRVAFELGRGNSGRHRNSATGRRAAFVNTWNIFYYAECVSGLVTRLA